MLLDPPSFVIQRRIMHPLHDVHQGLADRARLGPIDLHDPGRDGFLFVDEQFRPVRSLVARQTAPTWCAGARLLDDRRRTVARVEIELSMWSSDSSELQLRPVARHPERWSSRKARRYFALAHRGADATARLVAHRVERGRAQGPRVGSRTTAHGQGGRYIVASSPPRGAHSECSGLRLGPS